MKRRIFHLICKNCNSEFASYGSSTYYCNDCTKEIVCADCGTDLYSRCLKTDDRKYYCKKCSYFHRKFEVICKNCNSSFIARGNKINYCNDCREELNFKNSHTCSMCGKFNENLTRDQNGRGYECGCHDKWNKEHWETINSLDKMQEIRKNNAKLLLNSKAFKMHIKEHNKNMVRKNFCNKCNEETLHRGNVCTVCSPKALGFIPKFICKNGILFYLDKSIGSYIPWEEYKAKFSTFNINFELPKGFKIYPTFLTQDSKHENVGGAFEQSLIDEGICWFVYIKFDENNKPLVVGKSGSKLVNISGSDVNFSMKTKDGTSKIFLQENNLNWCKTQIAICPCETEQEALELEGKILKNYNLFGS